jgi:hypothetical protein
MAEESKGRLLPAIVAFFVVAGGVYVAGLLGTWVLRHIVLPAVALVLGWVAARVVYKLRE